MLSGDAQEEYYDDDGNKKYRKYGPNNHADFANKRDSYIDELNALGKYLGKNVKNDVQYLDNAWKTKDINENGREPQLWSPDDDHSNLLQLNHGRETKTWY